MKQFCTKTECSCSQLHFVHPQLNPRSISHLWSSHLTTSVPNISPLSQPHITPAGRWVTSVSWGLEFAPDSALPSALRCIPSVSPAQSRLTQPREPSRATLGLQKGSTSHQLHLHSGSSLAAASCFHGLALVPARMPWRAAPSSPRTGQFCLYWVCSCREKLQDSRTWTGGQGQRGEQCSKGVPCSNHKMVSSLFLLNTLMK